MGPVLADVEVVRPVRMTGSVLTAATRMTMGAEEPVFGGHYPGFPIVPGVCLVECAHRSSLATRPDADGSLALVAVESARFHSPAFPGDELRLHIDWSRAAPGWRSAVAVETSSGTTAQVRLRYDSAPNARPRPDAAAHPGAAAGSGGGLAIGGLAIGPAEIQRLLPHRFPMLLVDRVVDLVPHEHIVAVKAVTATEPWYASTAGRFAYPATLLVESWCQAAGLLAAWHRPNPDVLTGRVMLFGGLTNARFYGPVRPGNLVEHRVRVLRAVDDATVFEGESRVGSDVVLSVARMVLASRPAEQLRRSPRDPAREV